MTTISQTKHTARRRHKHPCCLCNLSIVPGDMYWRCIGVDGRDLMASNSHTQCSDEAGLLDLFDDGDHVSAGILPQLDNHSFEWLAWYTARKVTP